MKTNILIILLISNVINPLAFADQKVLCVDKKIQDASFSANFDIKQSGSTVDLFIPSGEISDKSLSGLCQSDEGMIELSLTCNVMTSTDSGYKVRLFSLGGSSLKSTITSWNMTGEGQPISLPCKE